MSLSQRRLVLALGAAPGIGDKTVRRVLERQGAAGVDADALASASARDLQEVFGMSARAAEIWLEGRSRYLERAARLEEKLDRFGVRLLTIRDDDYPTRVHSFDPDPPALLFAYGNVRLLEANTFCVLSSRACPQAGLDLMERLAEEGVLRGETLVSGHDRPEYQCTAIVPLRWAAPRILVLDRGLFAALGKDLSDEPFRSARLWRHRFDPESDVAMSIGSPDLPFDARGNQKRDRLVAALSLRLDFVHVSERGNMEKLLSLALRASRPTRVGPFVADRPRWIESGAAPLEISSLP